MASWPVVVALAIVAALAFAGAPRALGHAELVVTTPSADAVLDEAPPRLEVRFSEAVGAPSDALRVIAPSGQELAALDLERPRPEIIAARLPGGLAEGTYTVAWRVVSGDSHPISGAFVFSVGAASAEGPAPGAAPARVGQGVDVAFDLVRALDLALVLLVAGGLWCLALALGAAGVARRHRLARGLGIAAALLVPVAGTGIVLQSATLAGSVGGGLHAGALADALDTSFGPPWVTRMALGATVALLLLLPPRGRPLRLGIVAVVATPLVALPALASHARADGALAVGADIVHTAAAAAWVGGLALLGLALLATGAPRRWDIAASAVPRFSRIALIATAALAGAGTVSAVRRLDSWQALWDDGYGRLVLVKIALFLALVAVGAVHQRVGVPRLRARVASRRVRTLFGRLVALELALMAAAIGVTAALVAHQPPSAGASAAAVAAGPADLGADLGPYRLRVVVTPATAGTNRIDIHVRDSAGRPVRPDELRAAAGLPERGVGRIELAARARGTGHHVAPDARLVLPGDWRFEIAVRFGEFESHRTTITVPIRQER